MDTRPREWVREADPTKLEYRGEGTKGPPILSRTSREGRVWAGFDAGRMGRYNLFCGQPDGRSARGQQANAKEHWKLMSHHNGQHVAELEIERNTEQAWSPHMPLAEVDRPRIARAVREILIAIGENPDREGLIKTPSRVARAYAELFAGLQTDPREHLKTVFHERYDEVVLLRNIEFHSLCEHHLLPFVGKAHVAYLPDGKVVGLSKLARLVEGFARRPQIQERLTTQVADALMDELQPLGAACVIEASHTCMTIRGVQKHGSLMTTSALRGIFKDNHASRQEILDLIHSAIPTVR